MGNESTENGDAGSPPANPSEGRSGFAYSDLADFVLGLSKVLAFVGVFASVMVGIYVAAKGYPFAGILGGFFACMGQLAWLVVLLRVEGLTAPARDAPPPIIAGPSEDEAAEGDAGEAFACLECGHPIPSGESACPACGWSFKLPRR